MVHIAAILRYVFRLTREVRFALNAIADDQLKSSPANSFGGYPSLTGFGYFLTLQVTLSGELDPNSQYLENIREVDVAVRSQLPAITAGKFASPVPLVAYMHDRLRERFGQRLESALLHLSPFLSLGVYRSEAPMIRLSQRFEFSASHRLHNPTLSDDENRRLFGKCNNPFGHGHNYELQVTLLCGEDTAPSTLATLPKIERIVDEAVVSRFDHKHLNSEVPEFAERIPTVENIAAVAYGLLKERFAGQIQLASVTVWETPKTWCEYSE
jgi:6-pyruvoyltetrahydropterin/6-carboxytetrahydropterin synthase